MSENDAKKPKLRKAKFQTDAEIEIKGAYGPDDAPGDATPAGTFPFSQQIPVALVETPDASDPSQTNVEADLLSVYAAVDSPVDLADIDFSGTITYAADDPAITGDEEFEHHIRPHVEIYPYSNLTAGAQQTALTGTRNVSIDSTRILPRKSVRLPLLRGSKLRPGKYRASIRLTQAGERTSLTKRITVRR